MQVFILLSTLKNRMAEEHQCFQTARWTPRALAVLTEISCVTGTLSHLSLPLFRHTAIVWCERLMPHWCEFISIYFDCVHPVLDAQRLWIDFSVKGKVFFSSHFSRAWTLIIEIWHKVLQKCAASIPVQSWSTLLNESWKYFCSSKRCRNTISKT